MTPKRVFVTQVKDSTFEAFKEMIDAIFFQLTGKKEDDGSITEEELKELYKKFIGESVK